MAVALLEKNRFVERKMLLSRAARSQERNERVEFLVQKVEERGDGGKGRAKG